MSSLFWSDGTSEQVVDFEEWHSLPKASERVLSGLIGWCQSAWSDLSPEARDWVSQISQDAAPDWELPDWVDFSSPELVQGAMKQLSCQLPAAWPSWIDLLPGQSNAFAVLLHIRQVLKNLSSADNLQQSLRLAEKAMELGIALARAHVQPYESKAQAKIKGETGLINSNKGTPKDSPNHQRIQNSDKKAAIWRQEAERQRKQNPQLSDTAIGKHIANNPVMPEGKPGYIRKTIKE